MSANPTIVLVHGAFADAASWAPVTRAALDAGFSSAEALRRAFIARLGISPSKYQRRFRTTGAEPAPAIQGESRLRPVV